MQQENSYNSAEIQETPTLGDKVWQFIRFAVITGMIFGISFFAMNFHAYKTILSSIFDAEAQQEKENTLVGAVGESEIDNDLLLPVLEGEKENSTSYAWLDFPIVPTDNRLVVPKLGRSVPIVDVDPTHLNGKNWPELEKEIQGALQSGVVHYPTTANPEQYGNVFITGHSSYYPWDPGQYKDVFALLNQLEIGDEYYIYYNQKKFTYKVIEKKIVQPTDTTVLEQPQDRRISTLMTCYPVGTATSRLTVIAEQISDTI